MPCGQRAKPACEKGSGPTSSPAGDRIHESGLNSRTCQSGRPAVAARTRQFLPSTSSSVSPFDQE